MPLFSNAPTAIALVGLPIMVPMPPTEAAIGIPTSNALENGFFPRFLIRGITEAITIEVVAEFDRIMEAAMVISIMPNSILPGTFSRQFQRKSEKICINPGLCHRFSEKESAQQQPYNAGGECLDIFPHIYRLRIDACTP